MAVAQAIPAARRKITEEEFLRLPDDGRKWELVDGEAREVPAGHKHDAIGIQVAVLLKPHARGRGVLAGSQAGFRMTTGNIRSPEVSFTRKERMSGGQPSEGFEDFAPDLAVEIISPSEQPDDMARKVAEYFGAGAAQVWHLFPETKQVTVYFSPLDTASFGPNEELDAGDLLPGFSCRTAELFDLE